MKALYIYREYVVRRRYLCK